MFERNNHQRSAPRSTHGTRPTRRAHRKSKIRNRKSKFAPPRRGVLLLVVLSMLVLFLMIGTAFIITAKQSEVSSKKLTQKALADADAAARGNLLDEVLMQIVRDTDNPQSVLRGHSLLNDEYGNDGFHGVAANVRWAADVNPTGGPPAGAGVANAGKGGVTLGQMLQLEFDSTADLSPVAGNQPIVDLYNQSLQLSKLDDAYSGQVLTFTTGAAKGISTRIIGYTPTSDGAGTFTVMAFPLADGRALYDPNDAKVNPSLLSGSRILINGRPFNGTGAGLDPTLATNPASPVPLLSARVPLGVTSGEIALLPNAVYFDPTAVVLSTGPGTQYFADQLSGTDMAGRGGADESYDAADFQNMLLAFMREEPEDQTGARGTLDDMILPSLHRPELINYWATRLNNAGGATPLVANAEVLRRVMLRPNWLDHPHFTGGNTLYMQYLLAYQADPTDPTAQQNLLGWASGLGGDRMSYDVDNDNDGVRDSVWVDAGLPLMRGPNGKLVKPMVTILLTDLDSRININTAGTLDTAGVIDQDTLDEAALAGGNEESDDTPRGMGWGVADITARAALGEDSTRDLLTGQNNGAVRGRYGNPVGPGTGGWYDMLGQVTYFGWPQWGTSRGTSFALPPDLRARYGNGINEYGQNVIEAALPSEQPGRNNNAGRLLTDSPYEAKLFAEGTDTANGQDASDAPFSLAEFERLLRIYDSDNVALPRRLRQLTAEGARPLERHRITPDSWEVPAPAITLPPELESLLAPLSEVDPNNNNMPYRRLPRTAAELFEVRSSRRTQQNRRGKIQIVPRATHGRPGRCH